MNTILDTSMLCALLDEKDVHHGEAERLLYAAQGTYILLPYIVIAELLACDVPGVYILERCRNLASAFLPDTGEEITRMSTFPLSVRKTLKANDCLILAHAIAHDAELSTFDQRLKRAYVKMRKG